jgi:hypothetical protein
MDKEDSPLQFAEERLRHHHASPLTRERRLRRPERVTRRFAVRMHKGEARTFERVDPSVELRCAQGSLWITHDGDPKDVILAPQESYRAEREDAMHVFALQPCVVEIEFEDDATVAR